MNSTLRRLFDWAEVWALLIPLIYLLFKRRQPRFLKPVIIYLFIALFINIAVDIIADYKKYFPNWLQSNNPIYNVHSIIRLACFSYFFIALKQSFFVRFKYVLPLLSLVVIIINFGFIENFGNPSHLSGNLLSAEAYLLLIYCMLYYLAKLSDDTVDISTGADFWIVTGLSIYVVVNFFVFLFYVPMIYQDGDLADDMWDIHNVAYILLCIFITKAFYESSRNQHTV